MTRLPQRTFYEASRPRCVSPTPPATGQSSAQLGRTITAPIAFRHRYRTKPFYSGPQPTSCERCWPLRV